MGILLFVLKYTYIWPSFLKENDKMGFPDEEKSWPVPLSLQWLLHLREEQPNQYR